MAQEVGVLAYLGDIEVNYANLFLGDKNSFINPYTKPQIPTNGLIALFDATNPSSYPGTGNIWYDLSPNGLVATPFSSSTFPTYNSTNKGLDFNGTSDSLYTFISSSVNTGSIITNFTQIIWLSQPDTGTGTERGITNLQTTNPASIDFDAISFNQDETPFPPLAPDAFRLTSAFAARNVTPNVTETVFNEYMMVTATRAGGANNFILYRQSAEVLGTNSYQPATYQATAAAGTAMLMGQRFFNNTNGTYPSDGWWSGSLSAVLMYNRALSAAEIQLIYSIGRFGLSI